MRFSYLHRILQAEYQSGFGRNLHLLTIRKHFRARANRGSRTGADRRPFAAAGDRADNRAKRRCAADHFAAAGAARTTFRFDIGAGDVNRTAVHGNRLQCEREDRPALYFARMLIIDKFHQHVGAARDDFAAIHRDRLIEAGAKCLAEPGRFRQL